jgi:ABC-type amino acid transport system permease subunit
MRGDEAALPARDKGPVRKFVRDYVDSRRTIGEFFLPVIMIVLVLTVIPNRFVQLLAILFMYGAMAYSLGSSFYFSRKIRKAVNEKFPGESTKGLGMYGWLRSTQMRKMRAPAPSFDIKKKA